MAVDLRVTHAVVQAASSEATELRVTQSIVQAASSDATELRVTHAIVQVASDAGSGSLDDPLFPASTSRRVLVIMS